MTQKTRVLHDSPDRSYAEKLDRFTQFAAPELRSIFSEIELNDRGPVLDAGCGTGFTTGLLAEVLGPDIVVAGLDLSLPHLQFASTRSDLPLVQGDLEQPCLPEGTFELIWCCNTINHIGDKASVIRSLRESLKPGGQLLLAQSGFLPEMFFAWDSHLDDALRLTCHLYYRDRYGLALSDTADVRGIHGLLRSAGFHQISVDTRIIERTQPLSETDRNYFQGAVYEDLWQSKIRPLLTRDNQEKLDMYCEPGSPDFWLDQPDFHHAQTITLCRGHKAD